jgi:tetrahydromethanopterin S-methyltransferase subunit G
LQADSLGRCFRDGRPPEEDGEANEANGMNATMLQPFLTTALPIMVTILLAVWLNSKGMDGIHKGMDRIHKRLDDTHKRLDDMRSDFDRRFDAIDKRLERIEAKLDNHETRLVRLEERTSALAGVR